MVYRVGWRVPSDPHGKDVPKQVLIWFNTAETSDHAVSRMHHATQENIAKNVYSGDFMRTDLQINNVDDLNEKWLNALGYPATTLNK